MTVNCTICGQPARKGAKLCRDCKAALKRARHETISELQPLSTGTRERRARRVVPAAVDPATRTMPSSLIARNVLLPRVAVALVALGATVVTAGYLGDRFLAREDAHPPSLDHRAADRQAPAAPNYAIEATTGTASVPSAVPIVDPGERQPARPGANKAPARATIAPVQVPPSEPAVEPMPETAPAPVAVEPAMPPPDRWQQMADAIARCGRDGVFSRIMCEQRARVEACEGYWGQAEQCPAGRRADYGQ